MKMMKHIKRKFLRSVKTNGNLLEMTTSNKVPEVNQHEVYRVIEDGSHYPIVLTEKNELIQCFAYRSPGGKHFFIPEPNLISVYFDIAQSQNRHLKLAKAELLTNLNLNGDVGTTLNKSYAFFESSAIGVFFLYNAVDAFSNLILPSDKEYIKRTERGDMHFSHEQMQRGIPLEDKIREVIPHFTGRYFHRDHGHKYDTIFKLKGLRDEIAHTKAYSQRNGPNYYKDIFTRLLDFDFDKALAHSKDLINYYEPNLIEECGCGRAE